MSPPAPNHLAIDIKLIPLLVQLTHKTLWNINNGKDYQGRNGHVRIECAF